MSVIRWRRWLAAALVAGLIAALAIASLALAGDLTIPLVSEETEDDPGAAADPAPVAAARARLAAELGIGEDQVTVVSVEPAEWRDSALGCPQPGRMYLQVITPGYRVVLEAQGWRYVYHTDLDRRVVTCEQPEPAPAVLDGEDAAPPTEETTMPAEEALPTEETTMPAEVPTATLTCSARALRLGAPGMEGVALQCAVQGAAPAETAFRLSATLVGRGGDTITLDPVCVGTLAAGSGTCGANVIQPVRYWGGGFTVSATLLGSGQTLGPVEVQPV